MRCFVASRNHGHRLGSACDVGSLAVSTRSATCSGYGVAYRTKGILGVNHTRLNQLAVRGFLPFEMHADGTRLYRREQLEVVANARDARWARHRASLIALGNEDAARNVTDHAP
jgi:hypothetical protein